MITCKNQKGETLGQIRKMIKERDVEGLINLIEHSEGYHRVERRIIKAVTALGKLKDIRAVTLLCNIVEAEQEPATLPRYKLDLTDGSTQEGFVYDSRHLKLCKAAMKALVEIGAPNGRKALEDAYNNADRRLKSSSDKWWHKRIKKSAKRALAKLNRKLTQQQS